jgi:hypothetical protein
VIADPTARENNTKNIVAVCDVGFVMVCEGAIRLT